MDFTIEDEITPTFDQIGPLCQNSTAPDLPLTSLEGIVGTWSPAVINTATVGTTTYTFTPEAGGCAIEASMVIEITDEITPVFAQIGPLCLGSDAPALPLISLEGIIGTWSPAVINTATVGTTTYTFTPEAGGCAIETTMDITIEDEIIPTFDQIGPLCQNSTAPALPLTSLEGIVGTWAPATINTTVVGTFIYTFTPEAGGCAIETTMDITIEDEIIPTFDQIGPLCQNSTAPDLPLTSLEGIIGTWSPAVINTATVGTTTYTFTPEAGGCAIETTMDITIEDEIIPTFDQIGPLCQNSTAPDLPLTSLEGIVGTWSPAVINIATVGTTTYTFTPEAGGCAIETTMDITIEDEITPTFDQIGPLCQNSTAPALPLISLEGIIGTWSPAVINTATVGTTTYTFTPEAGGCAIETTMDITIDDQITPTFAQIGPLCLGSQAPDLPATSIEGITGTWNPATIDMTATGTYTFTPDAGQCAIEASMVIEITDEITPVFAQIGPLCLGSDAPDLPSSSTTGITGTWTPANISTDTNGETDYLFTPDEGQCAGLAVMTITVSSPEIIDLHLTSTTFWLPNGGVEIVADGTALPLVYSITGNGTDWQNSPEFIDLAAGPYVAWVMDANGCMDSAPFEILNQVEGDVTISAETVEYCMNIPVIVPVDGSNFIEISSFFIELEFDPTVLSFNALEQVNPALAQGTFSTFVVDVNLNSSILQIRYSIFDGSATVPGGQNLFLLNFEALSPGISELKWNLLSCEIFESAGHQVPDLYVEGKATINPAPLIYATGNGEYCENDTLTLQAGPLNGEEATYTWTGPTGYTHHDSTWQLGALGMNDNGQFTVRAVNEFLCSDEETVDVLVNPKPLISLGYADTVCFGQPLWLDPNAGAEYENYLWHDGSTNETMLATEPGLYWVSVMDTKGCSAADSVMLEICSIDIILPNAFTPNGDELNDEFKPIIVGWEPGKYYMQIFNRWGELLFETNDYTEGWDGSYRGQLVPPGLYSYILVFEAPSYVTRLISSPVSGSVTVIR
jgi:gliding motility-associated-like protein